MVQDSELVEQLRLLLRESDLSITTTTSIRRTLEEHFGVDLTDRKAFIRENIDLYLQTIENEEEEEEEKGEEEQGGGEGQEEEEDEEEEDEEGEEEDDGGVGSSNGKSSRKKSSNKADSGTKRRGGGFTKLCTLSPLLQKFVGVAELPRTQVVKRIWAYIHENNLQDPHDRRKILCDDKLRELFDVKSINMFQMSKALTKHIWPLGSTYGPPKSDEKEGSETEKSKPSEKNKAKSKEKRAKKGSDSEEVNSHPKDKRQKVSGFLIPIRLSDALVKFIGTGECEMSRADVVKKIWDYIKENNLQDPSDRRRIICDDKLKELFQVETFTGFTVAKLLGAHFV